MQSDCGACKVVRAVILPLRGEGKREWSNDGGEEKGGEGWRKRGIKMRHEEREAPRFISRKNKKDSCLSIYSISITVKCELFRDNISMIWYMYMYSYEKKVLTTDLQAFSVTRLNTGHFYFDGGE